MLIVGGDSIRPLLILLVGDCVMIRGFRLKIGW